jgi:hypothetical protein
MRYLSFRIVLWDSFASFASLRATGDIRRIVRLRIAIFSPPFFETLISKEQKSPLIVGKIRDRSRKEMLPEWIYFGALGGTDAWNIIETCLENLTTASHTLAKLILEMSERHLVLGELIGVRTCI